MGLVNITDTELAMFLEDRLSEKDAAEITAAINDAETLWLLGEITNTNMIEFSKNMNVLPMRRKMQPERLFKELSEEDFDRVGFHTMDIGEGMYVIEQSICGWWKPRYLLDKNYGRAYEIMDETMNFATFKLKDVDWPSLLNLPVKAQERARNMSAHFPTFIRRFENGVAQVSWQLNPDGRYYMDEDGYGMTEDDEVEVYGYIDRQMNVLVKFRYIGDEYGQLKEMRREAERKLTV